MNFWLMTHFCENRRTQPNSVNLMIMANVTNSVMGALLHNGLICVRKQSLNLSLLVPYPPSPVCVTLLLSYRWKEHAPVMAVWYHGAGETFFNNTKEAQTRSLNAAHSSKSISSVCLPFSFHLSKITNREKKEQSKMFQRSEVIQQSVNLTSILLLSIHLTASFLSPILSVLFSSTSTLFLALVFTSHKQLLNNCVIFVPGMNKVVNWAMIIQ